MKLISCGINSNSGKNFKIELPTGPNYYVFLHLKTPTRFLVDGVVYDAKANDIFLYQKGNPLYFYGSVNTPHIDDYIHFDFDNDEDILFMKQLSLKCNQIIYLPNTHSFMEAHQLLCTEFICKNTFRKESLDNLMRYFLIKLSEAMHADYSIFDYNLQDHFSKLRLELYGSPSHKWNIKDMASSVNLSPSYFQFIYKKLFHVSCMADLFNSRMEHAKYLLVSTLLPIKNIAAECGYESNIYFSRHFKKITGMTPSDYRLHYGKTKQPHS